MYQLAQASDRKHVDFTSITNGASTSAGSTASTPAAAVASAGFTQLRRKDQVGRERGYARLGKEVPEGNRAVGEVEPQRRLGEQRAVRLQLLRGRAFSAGECKRKHGGDEDP